MLERNVSRENWVQRHDDDTWWDSGNKSGVCIFIQIAQIQIDACLKGGYCTSVSSPNMNFNC